ncbi:MAG: methionyl-tRNA formyltransferase [Candidatus Aminicenantes bacterium]|nr:MAG: methionyl-tRNA formyltransferase [Candidatus Aminicenantes bacterium]
MKIVFFGSPVLALPFLKKLLETDHSIDLIITQPDRPSGRGKKFKPCPVKKTALDLNIPYYQPLKIRKDEIALDKIKEIEPDLNVVVAYGQIIPSSIIYLPRYNSLNVHFSLLPKYRGASPVQKALLDGEAKTGITIFELNEKMDEGDILVQEEVNIFPDENAADLEARLAQKGADLLIKAIAQIDKLKHRKQDHSQATYAPKIRKEDGKIDWTKNSLYIERRVRAFTPWPSAYAFLKDIRIKIHRGRKIEKEAPPGFSAGKISGIKKEGIEVCCGEGSIYLIESLQPENRKRMDAYAFSLGAEIKPGDIFA